MAKKRSRKGRIRSKAQRRKFAELLMKGKIKPEVYERWNRAAGGKELPERVRRKTKKKRHSERYCGSSPTFFTSAAYLAISVRNATCACSVVVTRIVFPCFAIASLTAASLNAETTAS